MGGGGGKLKRIYMVKSMEPFRVKCSSVNSCSRVAYIKCVGCWAYPTIWQNCFLQYSPPNTCSINAFNKSSIMFTLRHIIFLPFVEDLACATDESKLWLSLSARQHQNHFSGLPTVYPNFTKKPLPFLFANQMIH